VPELPELRGAALEIFRAALCRADAYQAVRRAVHLKGQALVVCETAINLAARRKAIYAIAIGKAAHAMAGALDEILDERLTAGLIAGLPVSQEAPEAFAPATRAAFSLSHRWRVFAGGHPLPNEESLAAARAAFEIMERAEETRALVLFLISGGGSALIEWPRDERLTLAELREAHRALVHSGASIAEINAVRRALSAVKGGGLSSRAPHAAQLSLIISDTNPGEEHNVASGPTFDAWAGAPEAAAVIARYNLAERLPGSILSAIARQRSSKIALPLEPLRRHYVLLTNADAVAGAADAARALGFIVETAEDICEQEIGDGCARLLDRLRDAYRRSAGKLVCLLSGGEFACPLRGAGVGGRNSETALRLALAIGERRDAEHNPAWPAHIVALSAGTDGIDGNSPAAGAVSDHLTLPRAVALGLDARRFLEESDAYSFFAALKDTVQTGATGTNVRDVRVLLAG
jgi:hydroxypyruvate reductase